jgi:arabinogalactan endo-1,4-beta-galactosidase
MNMGSDGRVVVGIFGVVVGLYGCGSGNGGSGPDGGSGSVDASLGGGEAGFTGADSSSRDGTLPADGGGSADGTGFADSAGFADAAGSADGASFADSAGSTDGAGPTDSGGGSVESGGGGVESGVDSGSPAAFPFRPAFIIGADISYTLQDEATGVTYSDGTSVKPLEEIMANNGFNFIRLRTFVEPSASDGYAPGSANTAGAPGFGTATGGWCSTAATVQMAQRVKRCGMGLFVDFHMRDTWASLGSQGTPSSWVGLSTTPEGPVSASTHQNNIFQTAHDYVAGVMQALVAGGVKPDMVQIGNETNSDMSGIDITDQPAYATLVNAGITAVRETDPKIIVWAQNGRPRPDSAGGDNFDGWVDVYLSGKAPNTPAIDEDGICGSTYGTTNNGADWTTCFDYVLNTYNKPVMSCEYVNTSPDAPAGAVINPIMHGFPNHMGFGSFVWEPTRYPNINANGTLFTMTGNTYTTNAAMTAYPTLAKSYGLPVPSGTCK